MQNDIKNLFNTKKDNLILNNFNNKNLNQQVNFFYLKKIFTKNIYFLVDEDLNINNKIDYAVVNPWTNYSIHLKEIIDSIIKK
jgi:hypothetical protein